jgi:PKD repeat protein
MKKLILLLLFIANIFISVKAQTDTVFWFAVPYMTGNHNPPRHAVLTVTATDPTKITTVTVTQPSNPQIAPITIVINPLVPPYSLTQTHFFDQANLLLISSNLYNTNVNTTPENSALLVKADNEITAYFELHRPQVAPLPTNGNNPDIFTLKGKNALGTDFWVPFQNYWNNHNEAAWAADPAFSQIDIVAIEDNTIITITFNKPAYGYPAGTYILDTLDKGETYMFVPAPSASAIISYATNPSPRYQDRLTGTHITSNKPIAVTIGDDSVQKQSAYDYNGDQMVPVRNYLGKKTIGLEYIVMKGQVDNDNGGERVFVLSTTAGTTITATFDNGSIVNYGPLAAGAQQQILLNPGATTYKYVHLEANSGHPIVVYHMSGFGDEMGGAILPTIDGCTGSLSVSFVRSKVGNLSQASGSHQWMYLNLMCKPDAVDSFYINNGITTYHINPSWFVPVPNSSWYVLDKNATIYNWFDANIFVGQVTRIYNTMNVFHLGAINGITSEGGCVYGYFSDYNELEGYAIIEDQSSVFATCDPDSIQLKAGGGLSYTWTPTDYLDNPTSATPYFIPADKKDSLYTFLVHIQRPCFSDTTFMVIVDVMHSPDAFFSVNSRQDCAPLEITVEDASRSGSYYVMDLGDGTPPTISSSPINITHTYNNLTDTVIRFPIGYTVQSLGGCNSYFRDTITVFPQIVSSFSLANQADTVGCHPLTVDFLSTSTGNTDTYLWNFGDGSTNSDTNISHIYKNFSANDTTFDVQLISTSPYLCSDASNLVRIRIHPIINSDFSVDSTLSCSPINYIINPTNSLQVDTFNYHIYDQFNAYFDTSFTNLNENFIPISYSDTSMSYPDTLRIKLIGASRFGCYDTSATRKIIVYPIVTADFLKSNDDVCDSTRINFTNHSSGYNLNYLWDFDNGNTSSLAQPSQLFFNRNVVDTTYHIRLIAYSEFYCSDTIYDSIHVFPYVKADFGMDFENNCSPITVTFSNTSIGSPHNFWDFASGTSLEINSPTITTSFSNPHANSDTTYTIELIALNNYGCRDTLMRNILLFPKVVAAFNLVQNSNCPPLNVDFTNNSAGGNLTYTWEFGDNTSSANPAPNFSKEYNNNAPNDLIYPIRLTARNQVGCDSSWYDTIPVFARIDAAFSLDDYENCPPFTIQATEDCSEGTNIFDWTFGDGNISSLHNPSNTYFNNTLQNDSLTVRLIALGANDAAHQLCADTAERTIVVFPKLVADFEFTADSVACQPLVTGIQNNSNLLTGSEFRWFIDNEFYQRAETPADITLSNNQNVDISKTVYLYGRTSNGCLDTTSHELTAYSLVSAYFTIDRDTLCSGDSINIDRQNSQGGITGYFWSFDGEAPAPDATPVFYHDYVNLTGGVPIDKNVLLIVENSHNCIDSMQRRVTIAPQVNADFSFDNNSVCYPHLTQITNSTQYADSYLWDFGDNINSTQSNPEHLYNNFSKTDDETFFVKLTAKSRYNCYDSIRHQIEIKAKPAADFYFPVTADCPPFVAQMENNSIGSGLTYLWDFAGEGTSTEAAPDHTFSNESNDIDDRTITLIVTSGVNCTDTMEKSLSVYPNVHADFTMSDNAGCSPMNIEFTGNPNATVAQMLWFIDGRAFSTIKDPSYRFENDSPAERPYTIRFVTLSLYECSDTMDKTVTVYPTPVSEFIPNPLPAEYGIETDETPITFSNETTHQNNWSYEWNYGNGDINNESDAEFTYNYGALVWGSRVNDFRIPVRLVAWNSANPECRDTIIHDIMIYPPMPKVDVAEDIAACVPFEVNFESWTKYVYEDSLLWDFGDGNFSTEPDPIYTYSNPGVYTVKLIVRGEGGTNWDYKIVTVNPKPEVDFTFNDSIVFDSSQTKGYDWINFYNHTKYATNYYWYFDSENNLGGAPDSEEKEPYWHYNDIGTYYVALVAESGEGCLDTLIHRTPIRVLGGGYLKYPTAFFVSPDGPRDEYDTRRETNKMVFYPLNEGIDEYKLEIYNRWGVLVFESNEVDRGWNGFIQGTPAKQDVYVWRARGRFTNGQPFDMSGDVTLIRGRDEAIPDNL